MKPTRRPTLHDVAREAGKSHMTVSRVVRGLHIVSPKTEVKIQNAIRKLGYHPDPVLSALAAYRTSSLQTGKGSTFAFLKAEDSSYSQRVLEGVRSESSQWGYQVEVFSFHKDSSRQKQLARMLFHRGFRGLLFGPTHQAWNFEGWEWPAFASVVLGGLDHQPTMHAVAMDYFHGARTASRFLLSQGCTRLALIINQDLEARTDHRWLGGYESSLPVAAKHLILSPPHNKSKVQEWLKKNRVDGVLTIHGGIGEVTRHLKINTVFLNHFEAIKSFPHLHLEPSLIGAEGVRLLHQLLLKNDLGLPAEPKMVALRAKWIP
jgi:LacI family transcriptional regulator